MSNPMHGIRFLLSALALASVVGCGSLLPKSAAPPSYYSLDLVRPGVAGNVKVAAGAPTLVVNPPRAAGGYDSNRIIYTRDAHKIEYFAHSEWIDTPARMLTPLIVSAIENSGTFRAVLPTPSAASADIKLDIEILQLRQDFAEHPSRVRFTLRAYLVDSLTRRVLAWREFDESVASAGDDPYNGVVAANRAVQNVMTRLTGLCAEAAAGWVPPPASGGSK